MIYKVCLTAEHENGIFNVSVAAQNEEHAAKEAVKALEKAYPIYKGDLTVYSVRQIEV